MKSIVILISGRGSNMEAIVKAQIPGAQVRAVFSNRPQAAGLELLPGRQVDDDGDEFFQHGVASGGGGWVRG